MRPIANLIVTCLALALLSGCAITNKYGPYMGKVVDKGTNEPIEGAVVFMEFSSSKPNWGGSTTNYIDAAEVLTDVKGEFHLSPPRIWTFRWNEGWERGSVIIFKPGYGVFPGNWDATANYGRSQYMPSKEYVTVKLPKLKNREERGRNAGGVLSFNRSDVPYENYKLLFNAVNNEYISLGFEPYPDPRKFKWSK
jgi:hypothetical protein